MQPPFLLPEAEANIYFNHTCQHEAGGNHCNAVPVLFRLSQEMDNGGIAIPPALVNEDAMRWRTCRFLTT